MSEAAQGGVIFAAIVIIAIIALAWSAGRHPMSSCRSCKGTGIRRSWLLPGRWRNCTSCSAGVINRRPL
ncbi:hypothetical protein [Sphaerimonospora thailandensis]|uniref:Uncharacterized protein n=1 Tax=Sphaerimonospora thailandensis TaxID=795644 RepID=A0A8J3VYS4_9ACTN|nr:hypothetical protein [Sphaerimonospora thailandensis]GIH70369.1 hypothetical protein Mth01_26220 [Sphaerimonospora thailandensis]